MAVSRNQELLADKRLLLFDWSGTVSDDLRLVYEANMRLLERHGEERITLEEYRSGNRKWNAGLYLAATNKDIAPLYQEYGRILDALLLTEEPATMFPGTMELFSAAAEQGKRVGIISSHPIANLVGEMSAYGLVNLVATVQGGVSDKGPAIRTAYTQAGMSPSETAYIGDTVPDVRGAREAGIFAVAITQGYHSEALLRAEKPDLVVASLPELISHLSA